MSDYGPDGLCIGECTKVRFSPNQKLPRGYSVWWHAESGHYQGHAPNGDASSIHWDRFACRRWCLYHKARS